jgi:hypothetical protein
VLRRPLYVWYAQAAEKYDAYFHAAAEHFAARHVPGGVDKVE